MSFCSITIRSCTALVQKKMSFKPKKQKPLYKLSYQITALHRRWSVCSTYIFMHLCYLYSEDSKRWFLLKFAKLWISVACQVKYLLVVVQLFFYNSQRQKCKLIGCSKKLYQILSKIAILRKGGKILSK